LDFLQFSDSLFSDQEMVSIIHHHGGVLRLGLLSPELWYFLQWCTICKKCKLRDKRPNLNGINLSTLIYTKKQSLMSLCGHLLSLLMHNDIVLHLPFLSWMNPVYWYSLRRAWVWHLVYVIHRQTVSLTYRRTSFTAPFFLHGMFWGQKKVVNSPKVTMTFSVYTYILIYHLSSGTVAVPAIRSVAISFLIGRGDCAMYEGKKKRLSLPIFHNSGWSSSDHLWYEWFYIGSMR
jgi:hypothetical protein